MHVVVPAELQFNALKAQSKGTDIEARFWGHVDLMSARIAAVGAYTHKPPCQCCVSSLLSISHPLTNTTHTYAHAQLGQMRPLVDKRGVAKFDKRLARLLQLIAMLHSDTVRAGLQPLSARLEQYKGNLLFGKAYGTCCSLPLSLTLPLQPRPVQSLTPTSAPARPSASQPGALLSAPSSC